MFLTFPFLLHDAADQLIRRWRRVGRRVRSRGETSHRPTGHTGGLRVDRIDDPDGTARIVRIVGAMSPATLPRVLGAWSDAMTPHLVHIDVADAVIIDLSTMLAFERAIDDLERRQIDIRISGLDPSHPALIA